MLNWNPASAILTAVFAITNESDTAINLPDFQKQSISLWKELFSQFSERAA